MITKEVKDTTMGKLMRVMGLGGAPYELEAICRTSDGFYMGQLAGDLGYNIFIGKPAKPHPGPGRDLTLSAWRGLSEQERKQVLALAACPPDGSPIPLAREFGLPMKGEGENEH